MEVYGRSKKWIPVGKTQNGTENPNTEVFNLVFFGQIDNLQYYPYNRMKQRKEVDNPRSKRGEIGVLQ